MKILPLLYTIPICNRLRCWSVRKKIVKGYKMRSGDEILKKKNELHDKMLVAGRAKSDEQQNIYQHQIDILDWIIGEKND